MLHFLFLLEFDARLIKRQDTDALEVLDRLCDFPALCEEES